MKKQKSFSLPKFSSNVEKNVIEDRQMMLIRKVIKKSIDWQEAIEKINKEFPSLSEEVTDELIREYFF